MVKVWRILFFITLICTLTACNNGTPTSQPTMLEGDRDVAWVDWDYSKVVVMESYPMQVDVIVRGDVPSPCHDIHYEVAEPNEKYEIHIEVWSIVDPGVTCAALLEAFEEQIRIGDFTEGGYTVWVNGVQVGEF
jgi:hypothetical protein